VKKCSRCPVTKDFSSFTSLVVDHSHVTGKVRGYICSACNSVLGYSKDNTSILEAAIAYLKASNEDNSKVRQVVSDL
jgi:hypothetical protein